MAHSSRIDSPTPAYIDHDFDKLSTNLRRTWGQPTAVTYANGVTEACAYDPARGWLTGVTGTLPGGDMAFRALYDGSATGRIFRADTQALIAGQPTDMGGSYDYAYDYAGRLLAATNRRGVTAFTQVFAYDRAGRIRAKGSAILPSFHLDCFDHLQKAFKIELKFNGWLGKRDHYLPAAEFPYFRLRATRNLGNCRIFCQNLDLAVDLDLLGKFYPVAGAGTLIFECIDPVDLVERDYQTALPIQFDCDDATLHLVDNALRALRQFRRSCTADYLDFFASGKIHISG